MFNFKFFLVIDLFNEGSIRSETYLSSLNDTTNLQNSSPAKVSLVTAETTNLMYGITGGYLYVVDYDGSLWKINYTDLQYKNDTTVNFGDIAKISDIGLGDIDSTNSITEKRVSYTKPVPFLEKDLSGNLTLAITYGSGDYYNLDNVKTQNYLIKVIDENFPYYNTNGTVLSGFQGAVENIDDLATINDGSIDTTTSTNCPSSFKYQFQPEESLFTNIIVKDSNFVFTTYKQSAVSCQAGGSFLYSLDTECAVSGFGTDENIQISTGITSSPVIYKDQIFISNNSDNSIDLTGTTLQKNDTLIYGEIESISYIPIVVTHTKEVEE